MIRLYFASSIDGFIATPDDGVDWLQPFQTDDLGFHEFMEQISVVVMGRRTFDRIESWGSWPYGRTRGIVLSSRPLKASFTNVEWSNEPLEVLIERLRRDSISGDVWVEGGKAMGAFLEARAVDLVEHYIVPIALGAGIPMFGAFREPLKFETREIERFDSGVVKHTFVPK